jgi:hypothetical protein
MPHGHAVETAASLDGAMAHGEGCGIALAERHHDRPRLHPGTLLGQNQLASIKRNAWSRKQDHHLQRKHHGAVQILMQAVAVAGAVAKQEEGGPDLAGRMAASQVLGVRRRIDRLKSE